jgi:hypothetical protein
MTSRPETHAEDEKRAARLWRVRVCMPGSIIHLASATEPVLHMQEGRVADVAMTPVADRGDTIGFVDWPAAIAVTWRREQDAPPNKKLRAKVKGRRTRRRAPAGAITTETDDFAAENAAYRSHSPTIAEAIIARGRRS